MKLKRLHYILLSIVLLIIVATATLAYSIFAKNHTDEILLRVNQGDNARSIAGKLREAGVIKSELLFIAIARLTGVERDLKAGVYNFGGYNSLIQTVRKMQLGNSIAINVTFPEGLSLFATCKKLERSGLIDFKSVYETANDPQIVKQLTGMEYSSLEGFLYPETYRFELGMTPLEILQLQTQEFFKRIKASGLDPQADPQFYDKLILASIVESESMYEDERPMVAGVYLNRLKKGMKLEACPTVDYFLEQQGIHREVLLLRDVNTPSPYNTYLNLGLPPTPICNPSISSIKAVYEPAQHSYLFFQADRQGRNVFSVTYREHQRKMANLPSRLESR